MPTARGFTRKVFQCGLYEAQDVLAEIEDVDLMCLEPQAGFEFKSTWQRRLLYRDRTRRLVFMNPGLKRVQLAQDYDLFIAVCPLYRDLLYINAIDGWKDRCRVKVCWLDELWAQYIPRSRYWLHALKQFDHVFIGYRGSVDAVSEAIGRQCHWLPGAVDALGFSPYPTPPARVVDVCSIGRRFEGIHQSVLRQAAKNGLFYVHDTAPWSETDVFDHRQHRTSLANLAKRSRYFLVAPGKMNAPGERAGQIEVAFRYFEGAAAGTVMVGQAPVTPSFSEMFDWPDAVIEIKPDGSDVVEILHEMDRQPERLKTISRRNAAQALLRHDWLYRWNRIFEVAGVQMGPGSAARAHRLSELASVAQGTPNQAHA